MACCLVGSLFMVGIAALVRRVRQQLLRLPAHAPEAWRLDTLHGPPPR